MGFNTEIAAFAPAWPFISSLRNLILWSAVLHSHKTTDTFLNICHIFAVIFYCVLSYKHDESVTADLTIYDFLFSFHLLDTNVPFKVKHGSF